MANIRIRHNVRAYQKLRSAPAVRTDLERRAKALANKCNSDADTDGFRVSSQQGGGSAPRWRTTVITARAKAITHNAMNNTLIKNLGSAR